MGVDRQRPPATELNAVVLHDDRRFWRSTYEQLPTTSAGAWAVMSGWIKQVEHGL